MNWEQLKTILWLRWRLLRNQTHRGGGWLGAAVTVFLTLVALGIGVASFIGGFCGGFFGLTDQSPQVVMFAWLAITLFFLFFWGIGLLTELQRSETIDLQKLMHLPVALGQMFTINYLVSHLTPGIVMVVPLMFGLGLGLTVARGPLMILTIPLAISTVLMISAWTYCLRGWLATMMSNPRRRRTVIMFITLAFVLLAQGPNLYFNVFQRNFGASGKTQAERQEQHARKEADTGAFFQKLFAAQPFVPPLWLPVGARNLAEGNPLPALLGTLGGLGIAALGLRRAYRNTVGFYLGEGNGKAAVKPAVSGGEKKSPSVRAKNGQTFLERSLPFVPEQSSALALATLRSLLRAPEVKMSLGSSFVVSIILGAGFLFRSTANVSDTVKPFIATGSVVFPVFFLAQFFGNQFGFDRDGFRSLILSPADRRLILLGKNLAAFPVAAFFGVLLAGLTAWRLHLAATTALATVFQLGSVLLMAGIVGNLLSILVPYRIQPGTMKPTKMPGLAMLLLMMCHMFYPVALLPVLAGPLLEMLWRRLQWPDFVPVNLICSALLLVVMAIIYWQTLEPLGRLLQRRETKILSVITVEVE